MIKNSKKKVTEDIYRGIQSKGLNFDPSMLAYSATGDVLHTLSAEIEVYVKQVVEAAFEELIKNTYCQDDFETDMGVKDNDENV